MRQSTQLYILSLCQSVWETQLWNMTPERNRDAGMIKLWYIYAGLRANDDFEMGKAFFFFTWFISALTSIDMSFIPLPKKEGYWPWNVKVCLDIVVTARKHLITTSTCIWTYMQVLLVFHEVSCISPFLTKPQSCSGLQMMSSNLILSLPFLWHWFQATCEDLWRLTH